MANAYYSGNAPQGASYGAPLLTWLPSQLADLPNKYYQGTQQARTLALQNAFPNGLSEPGLKNPDGTPNITAISDRLMRLGGAQAVSELMPLLVGQAGASQFMQAIQGAEGYVNSGAPTPMGSGGQGGSMGSGAAPAPRPQANPPVGGAGANGVNPGSLGAVMPGSGSPDAPFEPSQAEHFRTLGSRDYAGTFFVGPNGKTYQTDTPAGRRVLQSQGAVADGDVPPAPSSSVQNGRSAAPENESGATGAPGPANAQVASRFPDFTTEGGASQITTAGPPGPIATPPRSAQAAPMTPSRPTQGSGSSSSDQHRYMPPVQERAPVPQINDPQAQRLYTVATALHAQAIAMGKYDPKGAEAYENASKQYFERAKSRQDAVNEQAKLTPEEKNQLSGVDERHQIIENQIKASQAAQNGLQLSADAAREAHDWLGGAIGMLNDPSFYSGMGANTVLDFRRAQAMFGSRYGALPMELSDKFKAMMTQAAILEVKGSASAAGQQNNRIFAAQVQLAVQSAMKMPNTVAGNMALANIFTRAYERKMQINEMAQEYLTKNTTLDKGFRDQVNRWLNQHPLLSQKEEANINRIGFPEAPAYIARDPTRLDAWARSMGFKPGDPFVAQRPDYEAGTEAVYKQWHPQTPDVRQPHPHAGYPGAPAQ